MKKFVTRLVQYKKKLFSVAVGQIFAALGSLVGVRLLTESISPALFGEYKLILAGISLTTGIFIRPFIQFSMREYHDAKKKEVLAQFTRAARSLLIKYNVLLLLVIGVVISVFLYIDSRMPIVTILLILAVFSLGNHVEFERALFITSNRQISASLVAVVRNWLIPIAIVATVELLNEQTVFMLFIATMTVLSLIYFSQRFFTAGANNKKQLNFGELSQLRLIKSAISFGLPLAGVGVLSWLVHESDRFFLAYYHSETMVGIYSAAYGLVSAPFTLVAGAMAQFLYPIMFQAAADNDDKKRIKIMQAMLKTTTIVSALGLMLVAFFDEQLAWVAFGEEYRAGALELLLWIAMGYGFLAISMSFDLAAFGHKRTADMLLAYGVSAISNVTLNILFIPEYGAMGAVIATLVSLFVYLIIMASLFFYREAHLVSSTTDR